MRTTSRVLAAMTILAMACSDEWPSEPEGVLGPGTETGAGSDAPEAMRSRRVAHAR